MKERPQPNKSWTSNLATDKEKEEFVKRLLESKDLFRRLNEICEVMRKSNNQERIEKSSYEKPAWSEYQADANGFERAIDKIQNYLNFTKD